ncbi:hypothetical protein A6A04_12325 [Paramagnetospirillum marisnigri]|uniref:Uncharacterized protein n=1 Tax=Paramagnetospirillum marisnigri TaxID=1285242 RepID=A0A178MX20_9PROT|nr:hypothetical protein [Paramagnetospirillum marisnigri]OAN54026.1 hypothetical protein A6A04_12325 [Paramagnetospirillum marisnigri]
MVKVMCLLHMVPKMLKTYPISKVYAAAKTYRQQARSWRGGPLHIPTRRATLVDAVGLATMAFMRKAGWPVEVAQRAAAKAAEAANTDNPDLVAVYGHGDSWSVTRATRDSIGRLTDGGYLTFVLSVAWVRESILQRLEP